MTEALIFRTVLNKRVTLLADDVLRVWEGLEPGTVTLEMIDDVKIDVIGDYDFISDILFRSESATPEDVGFSASKQAADMEVAETVVELLHERQRKSL